MARVKVRTILADHGVDVSEGVKVKDSPEAMEVIQAWVMDSVVPACCDEGCEVEPDGQCEHDCPSVLIALGLM